MVRSRLTLHTTHFLQVSFDYSQLKIIKYMIRRSAKHWKIYIPVDKHYSTTVEAGSISYPNTVWMFDVQKCIFSNSVLLKCQYPCNPIFFCKKSVQHDLAKHAVITLPNPHDRWGFTVQHFRVNSLRFNIISIQWKIPFVQHENS